MYIYTNVFVNYVCIYMYVFICLVLDGIEGTLNQVVFSFNIRQEADAYTNFGTKKSQDLKFIEWQASGLGDAYRAAMAEQGVLAEVPWAPYGPSAGALASFMALAIRDADDASTIGVYCGQMPPEAMSVEDVEVLCTMDAVASSFEGSINFVGLGQPLQANLGQQVPCFSGRTAEAFLNLLDLHVAEGYPLGDDATKVWCVLGYCFLPLSLRCGF